MDIFSFFKVYKHFNFSLIGAQRYRPLWLYSLQVTAPPTFRTSVHFVFHSFLLSSQFCWIAFLLQIQFSLSFLLDCPVFLGAGLFLSSTLNIFFYPSFSAISVFPPFLLLFPMPLYLVWVLLVASWSDPLMLCLLPSSLLATHKPRR